MYPLVIIIKYNMVLLSSNNKLNINENYSLLIIAFKYNIYLLSYHNSN